MSTSTTLACPKVFGAGSRPPSIPVRFRSPRPGGRGRTFRPSRQAVMLAVNNGHFAGVALAFTPGRGVVHVWRSLSPNRERLEHVGSFAGSCTSVAIARHLASGAVEPVVDRALADSIVIEGARSFDAALIRIAWVREGGEVDPRLSPVLRHSQAELDDMAGRTGVCDEHGVLELGAWLRKCDAAWLAKWTQEIDAEVDRRGAEERAGEERRRALRAFVEECLLLLGRIPRPDETPSAWDGLGLRSDPRRRVNRRKLGLERSGRVRHYDVSVHFWAAADTYGYIDFGPGPGWYWTVDNPNPDWRFCDPEGPYRTPEDAWGEAELTGIDEE